MKDTILPIGAEIIDRDTTQPTDLQRYDLAQRLTERGGSNVLIQCALGEDPSAFSNRTGLPAIKELRRSPPLDIG